MFNEKERCKECGERFDLLSVISFMFVMSLTFTLCYIAKDWWLFLVIMILYVILQGVKQYDESKVKRVKVDMSSTWKFLILMIFLILLIMVGVGLYVYDYAVKSDWINVFLNAYERLDEANMLDKSIRVINYFDDSIPFNYYNLTGGELD